MGNRSSIFLVYPLRNLFPLSFIFRLLILFFLQIHSPQRHNTIQLKGLHATIIQTLDTLAPSFLLFSMFFFVFLLRLLLRLPLFTLIEIRAPAVSTLPQLIFLFTGLNYCCYKMITRRKLC